MIDELPQEPLDIGEFADEVKDDCKNLLDDFSCMICFLLPTNNNSQC